jgi:hypothetical protein
MIMKNDVMPSIVQMDAEELQNLVAEVKETVATGIQLPKARKRVFTASDMWNIRRNAKSASAMLRR